MRDYHEPPTEMNDDDRDRIRALKSLQEEVEAVNWYQQRIAATKNDELREILKHNRDEEMEHATMTLEWLRRNMEAWDDVLRACLSTSKKAPNLEEREETSDAAGDLMIRSQDLPAFPPDGKEQ